jgi:hypothetical protein
MMLRLVTFPRFLIFFVILHASQMPSDGSAMEFEIGGTEQRVADANWVQATGPIEPDTPEKFIAFLKKGTFDRKRLRLNSPGGDLMAGMRLGAVLRDEGWATEIGDHQPDPEHAYMAAYMTATKRTPGECASACAFAFMGGVERRIDPGSSLGFHQFSRTEYSSNPDALNYNSSDLQSEQIVSAILLSYTLAMGVDPAILVKAGTTLPGEMHWVTRDELREYQIAFNVYQWLPWGLKAVGGGLVARSRRADDLYGMQAYCTSNDGAVFEISVSEVVEEPDRYRRWISEQCIPSGTFDTPGQHLIIGNSIDSKDFVTSKSEGGGFLIKIFLGSSPKVSGKPEFFWNDYMEACRWRDVRGSIEGFEATVKLAYKNCL